MKKNDFKGTSNCWSSFFLSTNKGDAIIPSKYQYTYKLYYELSQSIMLIGKISLISKHTNPHLSILGFT